MRISKPKERWFQIPNDPDNGRIKIRHLTPGERQDIMDLAYVQEIEYETDDEGNMTPKLKQSTNRKLDREETLMRSVVDWEKFFDEAGKPLKCTPENIVRASREIDGFAEHAHECRMKLEKDFEEDEKKLEKN